MSTPPPPTRLICAMVHDERAAGRRLLFVTNGHGEDSIAASLIARLPPSVGAAAFPVVGAGSAFAGICPIVGPRSQVPSQGWRNVKGSLRRDLAAGSLGTVPPMLAFLRQAKAQYDTIVVVGDFLGVALGWLAGLKGMVWLDVYRTGHGRLYGRLERLIAARCCAMAFCRHQVLAQQLEAVGIAASAPGNLMLDTVPYGTYDAQAVRGDRLAVTLLPGSRHFTDESFALQVAALRRVAAPIRPVAFLAVAGGIDPEALGQAAGLQFDSAPADTGALGTLSDAHLTIHAVRGSMGTLVTASDFVLSQAGTATVQALGLGRPVLTFRHARDRASRFADEQALFGDGRVVTSFDADELARAIRHLLTDPDDRKRRGQIGQDRVGQPGAMARIVAALTA